MTLRDDEAETYGLQEVGLEAYATGMAYGERVRQLRMARGWSQAELGRRARLNSQTVHNIEHGRNKGGWQSRIKIAKAFGITVAALDGRTEPSHTAERILPDAQAASGSAAAQLSTEELIGRIFEYVRELERRRSGGGFNPTPSSETP